MELLAGVAAAGLSLAAVSAGITKAVDFIRNVLDRDDEAPAWVWNVTPFALGIGASFGLQVEQLAIPEGLLTFEITGAAAQVLTGLALGGLASGWHEKFDEWSTRAKANTYRS